jgi:hypothetical protein
LIPLFFVAPDEDVSMESTDNDLTSVAKPISLPTPGQDQIVKGKFIQKNGPISKQVVSLFLSPPSFLHSPFLAKKNTPINITKGSQFPCSILSQPEVNQRSVVVKNVLISLSPIKILEVEELIKLRTMQS